MGRTAARKRVGVFVEWLADGYSDPIIDEIASCARQRGVDVRFFVGGSGVEDFPIPTRHIPNLYASAASIDGAVVVSLGNALSSGEVEQYFERLSGMPLCSVAVQWSSFPSVEVDNETGVRAGIAHLIRSHGRRRIACIRGPETSSEADKRFLAYRAVLDEFELPFDDRLVTSGSYVREHGEQAIRTFLDDRGVQFDAVVAANDAMALGAMQELQRRGVQIPGQVALLGFDDIDQGRHVRPPLSTVRQPVREHGRKAFELVLDQLDGRVVPLKTRIDSHLVLRKSCGCLLSRGTRVQSEPPKDHRDMRPVPLDDWLVECCRDLAVAVVPGGFAEAEARAVAAALRAAVAGDGSRPFLRVLEPILSCHAARADLMNLLPLLDAKRTEVRGRIGSVAEQGRLDEALRDASIMVSELAEGNEARLRYSAETQIHRLLRMNEALLAVRDFEQMSEILAGQLSALGVLACYVCVWQGDSVPAERARVIAACAANRVLKLPQEGLEFAAEELLPLELVDGSDRSDWLVCPMLRQEKARKAYVVLVRGTAESFVYDSLVDQIGSCFKRLELMRQVVEEVRLREHAERERIEREMQIARGIQTGILPREPRVPGLEVSGSMQPATEVGGDYYDIVPTDSGCWIGIGDVAGHGLPAGLVMLMCQSVLGGLVRSQPDAEPNVLLAVANRLLYDNIRERMLQDEHITLALYRFTVDGRLVFAGAHEPALVRRAKSGEVERIETTGLWTGIVEDVAPMTCSESAQLEVGDLLVLYTDGIPEARNEAGETFGEERLSEAVAAADAATVAEIRESILARVRAWMAQQEDDITLVVARYTGPAAD